MKMEQTECSGMSAYEIQMPGNYPEESIKHSKHGKSLKSRKFKEFEMGTTHGTYGGAQKYIHSFGRENIQKGTTWKTKAQMGG
jgi:hypothetical protein